jgi:hypothetical protein
MTNPGTVATSPIPAIEQRRCPCGFSISIDSCQRLGACPATSRVSTGRPKTSSPNDKLQKRHGTAADDQRYDLGLDAPVTPSDQHNGDDADERGRQQIFQLDSRCAEPDQHLADSVMGPQVANE